MGWWKVQDSEDVVGDEVFSELRQAALVVVERYQQDLNRRPTRSEWERLLLDAVQPVESLESEEVRYLSEDEAEPRAVHIVIDE